jgi:hypothetical protein
MLAHLTSNGCKRGDTRSHRKRDRLWCCGADALGGKITRAGQGLPPGRRAAHFP